MKYNSYCANIFYYLHLIISLYYYKAVLFYVRRLFKPESERKINRQRSKAWSFISLYAWLQSVAAQLVRIFPTESTATFKQPPHTAGLCRWLKQAHRLWHTQAVIGWTLSRPERLSVSWSSRKKKTVACFLSVEDFGPDIFCRCVYDTFNSSLQIPICAFFYWKESENVVLLPYTFFKR